MIIFLWISLVLQFMVIHTSKVILSTWHQEWLWAFVTLWPLDLHRWLSLSNDVVRLNIIKNKLVYVSNCIVDGLFERSLVAGVDTMQILFSHALVQISVMSIQIVLVLIFTFLVFDIPSRGPFVLVVLLLVFQGATGMAFGMFWF